MVGDTEAQTRNQTRRLMRDVTIAHAHCDLYCGVYDPAQAKIEALSVLKIAQKYQESNDEVFRARALQLKEERAEEVKHHLMVLWADFFTADHRKEFENLDDLFWRAIHQAGDAKKSADPADGQKLIDLIDEISDIFWKTEKAKGMGVYPPA
jgi:nickel superoxide dismutase